MTEKTAEREALEAKANELGVKFAANIGDETLAARVAEAEAARGAAAGSIRVDRSTGARSPMTEVLRLTRLARISGSSTLKRAK